MSERELVRLPVLNPPRPHVSYSELRLFRSCPWRWYVSVVLGKDVGERALAMEFGSAIHTAMESLWGAEVRPTFEELDAIFYREFDKNVEGLVMREDELQDLPRLREIGPRIIRDAAACPDLQGITPLKTELRLYESVSRTDGLDVRFKGFIDFIFVKRLARKSVIYIADFKTCSWGWSPKKAMDPEVHAQLLLYKHFFCKLMGQEPRDVTCAFILLKKDPLEGDPSVEVLKIASGPKALARAIDSLQSNITEMHSGIYERRREACVMEWTDRKTKEIRRIECPYLGNECPHPSSVARGGT